MAYGSDAGFKAYHMARGRGADLLAIEDDEIAPARLVGSEWLDAVYRSSFPGLKVGMRLQEREWPRQGGSDMYGYVIASDAVPIEIENATYEAAFRQLRSPGSLSIDYTPAKYRSASIDGAVSVTFNTFGNAADVQTQFAVIDQILAPLLTGSGNVSMLSGGITRV